MLMKRGGLYLLSCVAAVVTALSYAPFDCGFLAWFGLSPFLYALRKQGLLSAAVCAFLFGWVLSFTNFYWALNKTASVNFANILLLALIVSLYFLVFGFLYHF